MRRRPPPPLRVLALALALAAGCGYRPARPALPDGLRGLTVAPPDAARTQEPLLSPLLAEALVRRLREGGLDAGADDRRGGAILRCRLLALRQGGEVVSAASGALRAGTLRLQLECLAHRGGGGARWRSGLVWVERPLAVPAGDTPGGEAARRLALAQLADEAAARVVEALTSGL